MAASSRRVYSTSAGVAVPGTQRVTQMSAVRWRSSADRLLPREVEPQAIVLVNTMPAGSWFATAKANASPSRSTADVVHQRFAGVGRVALVAADHER